MVLRIVNLGLCSCENNAMCPTTVFNNAVRYYIEISKEAIVRWLSTSDNFCMLFVSRAGFSRVIKLFLDEPGVFMYYISV